MSNIVDKQLWEQVKENIKAKYGKRWNGFYSGLAVQEYKRLGGRYKGKKPPVESNPLERWYKEKWVNVTPNSDVIVFRPTVRVTADTPLLASQISKKEIARKKKEKERLSSNENLTPFVGLGLHKLELLKKYSDPVKVHRLGMKYGIDIVPSSRKDKKYQFVSPVSGKVVHFGAMNMFDYTFHKDEVRRHRFRTRNARFKEFPMYSPAWSSYYLLW